MEDHIVSVGRWLQQRRRTLGLTQANLAQQVAVAAAHIRKIEADERHPSSEVAERLAECRKIPQAERTAFLRFARGEASAQLPTALPTTLQEVPWRRSMSPRTNLPAQTTSLIGREQQVAAVSALLQRQGVRMVTLTGPGGVGKSRVALKVGSTVLGDFREGVFFIQLAPLSDPELVVSTIATVLTIKEGAELPLLELVKRELRDQELLLILDNFEQVLPAALRVAELLSAASHVRVLVTSRVRLRLSGEHEFPVPPLPLPDRKQPPDVEALTPYEAVALFIDRAQAVNRGFEIMTATAPVVAEICHRLDGIPLAIELAAAEQGVAAASTGKHG